MAQVISSFRGKFEFLSNFYPISVVYEGKIYPSSEHAFVAAKTLDEDIRATIALVPTAGKVKRLGKSLMLRNDWNAVRINEMRRILEDKFSPSRTDVPIFQWLTNTAPAILIEGNAWGDRFWGQSPVGEGRNELGKLLMSIRDDITRLFQ